MSARKRKPLALVDQAVARAAAEEAERERRWLAGRLMMLPLHWGRWVAAEHARRGGLAVPDANRFVLDLTEGAGGRLPLAAGDDVLRGVAKSMARDCLLLAGWHGGVSPWPTFWRCVDVARRFGVEAPKVAADDPLPAIRRLSCARWWLRALRRAVARRCESAAIRGGMVRRGLWVYVSQDQVERRRAQKRRNERAVADAALVDLDSAEEVALAEVVEGSLANPANRRAEMMVRIRGADELAGVRGDRVEFWTLTAPSRFHAQRITGAVAEPNPSFDGSTPKDAQAHLRAVWAQARAAWKRRGLRIYGLRTAEPHHDGCPHWHLVVYGAARDLRYARRLLRVYALRVDGDEPGARRVRFQAKPLTGGKAGASYAAKYIAKNIDGGGMEGERDTESGRRVVESARRVDAWASAWGVRQFQFFGLPSVGVWRALRRMREQVAPADSALERARVAADESRWCDFCLAVERGDVRLLFEPAGRATMYGDAAADVVVGVAEGGRRATLDRRRWALCWGEGATRAAVKKASAPRVPTWFEQALGVGFDLPWSGVNNCTVPENRGFRAGG